ncbi:hypothetical protein H257_16404 [Aphanomyces astaci]|uniref:Uncharacterized protein n=1 Tax=Aphanomyces astaci TaxID=112090 RepID=W4FL34_APHAT|nr:hypothetical protein H257_16404 [Aphanomyces astaci]ETV67428.1 hypothetical protein H257_16404 [Aphanomyces astaci]|eukprot:XP_009843119.1 hypothetical protein H257_16404 [Aphanomyces astaci]
MLVEEYVQERRTQAKASAALARTIELELKEHEDMPDLDYRNVTSPGGSLTGKRRPTSIHEIERKVNESWPLKTHWLNAFTSHYKRKSWLPGKHKMQYMPDSTGNSPINTLPYLNCRAASLLLSWKQTQPM